MTQRRTASGRRPVLVWLAIVLVLVLAIALASVVFVIAPERQFSAQATATAQAHASQATATAQAHASEVQRAYDAGVAFAAAGDWEKATEEFARVVGLEPGYKDAVAQLAEAKAKLAESAAAVTVEAQVMATAQAEATAKAQANAQATAVAAPTPTPKPIDLAANQSVECSSEEKQLGNICAHLTDGDPETGWGASDFGSQVVVVDLEQTAHIVVARWQVATPEGTWPVNVRVVVDGESVAKFSGDSENHDWIEVPIGRIGKVVKFEFGGGRWWVAGWELQVLGQPTQ